MKKINLLYLIALFGVFFSACHSDDDTWGDWTKSNSFPGEQRVSAVAFQYGDVVYVGMGYNQSLSTKDKYLKNFYSFNGNSWEKEMDFPEAGRKGCVGFVIGDTAYIGAGFRGKEVTGLNRDLYYSDFYKYDLKNKKWAMNGAEYLKTDIRDFTTDTVSCSFWGGVAFEMNGKGYAGTGQVDGRTSKNIYEYNPSTGTWTGKIFPGDARVGGVVFKVAGQMVLCLGSDGSQNVTDVYAFDGTNWHKKAPLVDQDGSWNDDYGKIPRAYAVAFSSNLDGGIDRGYICGGAGTKTAWEYRIDEDRWHEVTEFRDAMYIRIGGVGFAIKGYGYVTTGGSSLTTANDNSTWKFIPGIDEDENNDY